LEREMFEDAAAMTRDYESFQKRSKVIPIASHATAH
jgi:hypothetical protein